MPQLVQISDPPAGAGAKGSIRVDRREPVDTNQAPRLVFIGGMTQTLSSWGGQLRPCAQRRPVLAYEARGQGKTELSLSDVSLRQHVDDFAALLDALEIHEPVDLCGFSFGGRVSLAIAGTRPQLVRRLVISGVGTDRGALGRVIVRGWQAALRTGDLEALALISLADTLGPDYLARYEHQLDDFVRASITRNTYAGISALFAATLADDDPKWQPAALTTKVSCPTLVLGGALDRVAPPDEVADLADRLAHARHHVLPNVGHTVAIEAAQSWRELVLDFLDEKDVHER